MTIVLNGTTGITNDGGYTGDGVVFADTTPANTLVTTTGGNVGIGTSSPATTLHARKDSAGGTTYALYTDNGAAGAGTNIAGIGFVNAGAIKSSITAAVYGNDYIAFNVGGSGTTERARIDSSGNLLVGITSGFTSSKACFVSGTSGYWGSLSKGNDYVKSSMSTGSSAYMDFFYYNNTTASYAGYISIAGGVTTYATSSDARLKENIVDAPSALESVNSIQVRSFDWKNGVGSVEYGVIAQELYEVAPEGVSVGKDKEDGDMEVAWGFDGSKLVPRLIKAIQEQQAIITALTARVAALEGTQP